MAGERREVMARLVQAIAASAADLPLALRLCRASVDILGMDGGSLTLAYADSERLTLCATDEEAAELEDVQEVVGEGPSFAAYAERSIFTLAVDRVGDPRWPLLTNALHHQPRLTGRSIYAIPMAPGPQTMGVATFHQRRPRPLLVSAEVGQLLINTVAVALLRDPDVLEDGRYAAADSWHSRARVHQATGMVMAQLRLTPPDGLALIRAHAYAHHQTLAVVSDDIITGRLDFRLTDLDPESELP
jgi:hypothetical protein